VVSVDLQRPSAEKEDEALFVVVEMVDPLRHHFASDETAFGDDKHFDYLRKNEDLVTIGPELW
jgi:hypothetical protein